MTNSKEVSFFCVQLLMIEVLHDPVEGALCAVFGKVFGKQKIFLGTVSVAPRKLRIAGGERHGMKKLGLCPVVARTRH